MFCAFGAATRIQPRIETTAESEKTMTTAELLLQDYDIEMASTRRVLERVPEDKPEFKCHDKSMALGKLAMHVPRCQALARPF